MQVLDDKQLMKRLRALIGSRFHYLKQDWSLVEILVEEGTLVLSSLEKHAPIQADQYGQPARRSPENLVIPVFNPEGDGLSDELLELLANKQSD